LFSVNHDDLKLAVDDFEILKVLGRGGFGTVYLARKNDTQELVALKKMKKSKIAARNKVSTPSIFLYALLLTPTLATRNSERKRRYGPKREITMACTDDILVSERIRPLYCNGKLCPYS